MSNIDKQALRERYSAKPTPKCDICGAKMTIQRMSGSRVTYGCSGAIYDETGCHYSDGRSLADDHYEQSRVTVTDESDPDVLALLDELEAKDAKIANLTAERDALREGEMGDAKHSNTRAAADIYFQLVEECEIPAGGSLVEFVDWQAKRIADLESREVKLPELKMLRDYLAEVTHREREDILVGIRLEFFRAIEEAGVKIATACKGEAS